jgi:putative intracellular protease/amidase
MGGCGLGLTAPNRGDRIPKNRIGDPALAGYGRKVHRIEWVVLDRPARCAMSRTPDGKLLVEGKTVTGFTNGEEEEVGLTKVVPFLVEDELMSLGATFSKVKNWGVPTVADGQLITGQNPASSGPAAKLLIDTLNKKAK